MNRYYRNTGDVWMKSITGCLIGIVVIVVASCAPSAVSVNDEWTSSPAVRTVSNAHYEARLEPLKGNKPFYIAFRLTVINKTGAELEIDWNKTRWIHDGRNQGAMVFKGIEPEAFKFSTVPPDFVKPEDAFMREIMPYKLVAWAPLRDQNLSAGQRGLRPGMIPPGNNGIILVVRQKGRPIFEEMTVDIEARGK